MTCSHLYGWNIIVTLKTKTKLHYNNKTKILSYKTKTSYSLVRFQNNFHTKNLPLSDQYREANGDTLKTGVFTLFI